MKLNLEFTCQNIITLINVLDVPKVRKNLVSYGLLNKFHFKFLFDTDKCILPQTCMYVRKGYLCYGMFKLNLLAIYGNSEGEL